MSLRHPPRSLAHPPQVTVPLLVELVLIADKKLAAKAVDARQRRAEIVRYGVAERLQLLIGLAESHGQLLDALPLLVDVDTGSLAIAPFQLFDPPAQNLVRPLERRTRRLQLTLPSDVLMPKPQGA